MTTTSLGVFMNLQFERSVYQCLSRIHSVLVILFFMMLSISSMHGAFADTRSEFTVANGELSLGAPDGWKRVQPRSRIVETEFSIEPTKPGDQPGRMTSMGAGGSVEANIARWYGQFSQPDGSATKDKAALKTLRIAGCKVTLIDISGTFKDMPGGPFAGGQSIDRPDYRMMAAIIETTNNGNYFIKFYGPAETVEASSKGFQKMIEGMVSTK